MDIVEINNNVKIDELYDNKCWIHGNTKEDINITIFLITICGHQLSYTLNAINNLKLNYSILVNVVMNIKPTNKAYNTMVERCKTKYFIQLDEDMEIFPNALDIIYKHLELYKSNRYVNIFLHTFKLIDEYLGLGVPPLLLGLKLYNYDIMKNFQIPDCDKPVSQVDKLWHNPIIACGYIYIIASEIIGYHSKHRKPYDLLLRFSKSANSFLNTNIKKNSGDYCRIYRPISKINNINSIYSSIYYHFIALGYSEKKYNKNFDIFKKFYYIEQKGNNLRSYSIPIEFNNIPKKILNFNFKDFVNLLTTNILNINEYYVLIGILNTLFENYAYSFDKYPTNINNYFLRVFNFNLAIISLENNNDFNENLSCLDNIKYKYFNDKNEINSLTKIFDLIILFKKDNNFNELKDIILKKDRQNKTILILDKDIKIEANDYYVFVIDSQEGFIKYENNIYYINETLIPEEYKFYKIYTYPHKKYIIDNEYIFDINDYIEENILKIN